MEPTVVDNRDRFKAVPAPAILERVLPKLDGSSLAGIRKIILLDEDPHKKRSKSPVTARYNSLGNTRRGDVYLFFSHFEELEDELSDNEMYLTYLVARSLAHELYHHSVRSQRIRRRPKKQIEERDAQKHAQSVATHITHALYPKPQYQELWASMKETLERRNGEAVST